MDKTLSIAGAGGGLEFEIKQNFSLRCDVGVALTELKDPTRDVGKQVVVPAGEVHYYLSSSFTW